MSNEIRFGKGAHQLLFEIEERSFWFRSRNKLILWAIEKFYPQLAQHYLEIGCGTGFVLAAIAERFPSLSLMGTEGMLEGLAFAKKRVPHADFAVLDARTIPHEAAFDLAGAFDVLEHIPEDAEVLAQLYKALRPGGILFLTVPQHPWLWSEADDYARHVRRYTARELRAKASRAGFEELRLTSFVTMLLPLMVLSRWRQRPGTYNPTAEFDLNRTVDRSLERVLDLERWFIRLGVRWPLGGSLLLVARKPA
ncbi:MAG TPA: class I SAM-dependent methyltransferase [Oscillatoriaceae cyanobacterium]